MKKCSYTNQRERIVAEAISPVASELRLLDAADLISLLRFELYGNLLSNKARQPWEKVMKAQVMKAPWEDVFGIPHTEDSHQELGLHP